jgi:hypothetical protein
MIWIGPRRNRGADRLNVIVVTLCRFLDIGHGFLDRRQVRPDDIHSIL